LSDLQAAGVFDGVSRVTEKQAFTDVVTLLERAPRPPEASRWTGATPQQVAALEQRLGFRLPDSYRDWLAVCNGVIAGPGGIYGTGTPQDFIDVESVLGIHPEWTDRQWLSVAGDGNGNHYVMDVAREHIDADAVFFVDVDSDSDELAYIAASNLANVLWTFRNPDPPIGRPGGSRRAGRAAGL
jgi:cell wall assembly regulator SMI1